MEKKNDMTQVGQAFLELKSAIQGSSIKLGQNDDLQDIDRPNAERIHGYAIKATNDALNKFEAAMPVEYVEGTHILTMTHKLLMSSQALSETHPNAEVKDFARSVSAYLLMHVPVSRRIHDNPLRKLRLVEGVSEQDES
jgi:hypothetical protein